MEQVKYAGKWWLIALQGLIGVVFGLLLILLPEKTLTLITWLVGAYILGQGIIILLLSLISFSFGMMFLMSLVGIGTGLIFMANPGESLTFVFTIFAIWLLLSGLLQIVTSLIKEEKEGGLFVVGSGLLSIIFSILLFTHPTQSIALAGIFIGISILITGVMYTAFGLQLKNSLK